MKRRRFLTWLVALVGGCTRTPVLAAPSYRYQWRPGVARTDDPSIAHLGHSDGHRVYCNGEDMGRKVFAAQSGADGWVDRYVTDGNGRILVNATGRAPRVERCTGNVVVDLAEDGVLRSAPRGKNLGIIEDGTHGIARHGTAVRGRSAATSWGPPDGRPPAKPHSLPHPNQHSPSA